MEVRRHLVLGGELGAQREGAFLARIALDDRHLRALGNAGGASTQLMSVGLTRMGDSSAWNEPNAATATIAMRCFMGLPPYSKVQDSYAHQGASNTFHQSSRPIRAP